MDEGGGEVMKRKYGTMWSMDGMAEDEAGVGCLEGR